MKKIIKNLMRSVGFEIVSLRGIDGLRAIESDINDLFDLTARAYGIDKLSKSQLKQDIFVLLETGFKRNGFFVEFGATNGIDLSNTYLLEKRFGWNGILAEPATCWHEELKKNRTASIEIDCVWVESGKSLNFNMVSDAELSTINKFNDRDHHANLRQQGTNYQVKTISLLDLLVKYNAPKNIDFLSIDTEGSEFDILSAFDFDQYTISIITCEHNFTHDRQKIYELLTSKGYQRKFHGVSRWDDWYVRAD